MLQAQDACNGTHLYASLSQETLLCLSFHVREKLDDLFKSHQLVCVGWEMVMLRSLPLERLVKSEKFGQKFELL